MTTTASSAVSRTRRSASVAGEARIGTSPGSTLADMGIWGRVAFRDVRTIPDIAAVGDLTRAGLAYKAEPQSLRQALLNDAPSRRENNCSPADPSARHSLSVTRPLPFRGRAMMRAVPADAGRRETAT